MIPQTQKSQHDCIDAPVGYLYLILLEYSSHFFALNIEVQLHAKTPF